MCGNTKCPNEEKEKIINGIDVSEYFIDVVDEGGSTIDYKILPNSERLLVEKIYKQNQQLKCLEEENEKLKEYIKDLQVRKDRYYLQVLEYEKQISNWITFYIKINDIVSGNYEILDCQGLQDLRQIISEVVK